MIFRFLPRLSHQVTRRLRAARSIRCHGRRQELEPHPQLRVVVMVPGAVRLADIIFIVVPRRQLELDAQRFELVKEHLIKADIFR